MLDRNEEALTAIEKALAISDNPLLRWSRAEVLFAMGRLDAAEQDYLAAIALDPSAFTWASLADSYMKRGRIQGAIDAMKHAVEFSSRPYVTLVDLGDYYLNLRRPGDALQTFDEAARIAPKDIDTYDNGSFHFRVAQGRANAWVELGNLERATSFQEEALRFEPDASALWQRLGQLYRLQGRSEDADRASARANQTARTPDQK